MQSFKQGAPVVPGTLLGPGGEKSEGPGPCLQGAASLVVKASSNPSGPYSRMCVTVTGAASHSIQRKSTEGDFGLKRGRARSGFCWEHVANEDG